MEDRTRSWTVAKTVLAVLGVAGLVLVVVLYWRSEISPVTRAVDRYVDALAADDIDAAYGQLCAENRNRYSRDDFAERVHARKRIRSHEITGFELTDGSGTVDVKFRYVDGSSDVRTLYVTDESGQYQVCGGQY